jgi:hypothetical protein
MTRREFFHNAAGAATAGLAAFSGPEGLMAQNADKAKNLNLKVTDLKTYVVSRGEEPNSNNYRLCPHLHESGDCGDWRRFRDQQSHDHGGGD